jgi:hypothetical protein
LISAILSGAFELLDIASITARSRTALSGRGAFSRILSGGTLGLDTVHMQPALIWPKGKDLFWGDPLNEER